MPEQPLPPYRPLGGDLPVANRFLFELHDPPVEVGLFKEVQGLQVTVGVEEIAEGGENGFVHRVPGRMTWPPIVLRRGVTDSNVLFEWLVRSSGEGFAGAASRLTRSNATITALDAAGTRLRSWQLEAVFPVRWKGPDFSVESNAALEEELELTHHGFITLRPSRA